MSFLQQRIKCVFKNCGYSGGGARRAPPLKPKRARGLSPSLRGGGNQSYLTATQSVVIRYLTDQKGQPNPLREGTEWHRMA